MQANTNSVWDAAQGLSPIDKIILMEKLARQLKKESQKQKTSLQGKELYGMGKGIWDIDAQDYVNQTRQDRF